MPSARRRPALPRRYPSHVQITFLGQAGLFIETRGVSILCDPWFNPSFFGSWYPFPANDGIDPERIGHPTFLYVSHLHHDHFDPRFLRDHVDKGTTVLLPAYPLDDLKKALHGLGFERFIESVDLEPFQAGPLTLTIHALVAPDGRPDRRLGAARRRRRGPRPEHERLAAARARPPARRRAAGRRLPAVLRGDLVPDGLRLPGQRAAGPRAQEARRPVGPGAALRRGARPRVRGPVRRAAVLPRPGPVRVQRPPRQRVEHVPGPAHVPGLHGRARPRRRPPHAAGERRGRRQGPLRRRRIRSTRPRSSPTSARTWRPTRRARRRSSPPSGPPGRARGWTSCPSSRRGGTRCSSRRT